MGRSDKGERFRLGAQSKRSASFPTGRGRHFGCCLPAGFRNEALRPKNSQARGKKRGALRSSHREGNASRRWPGRKRCWGRSASALGLAENNEALFFCGLSLLKRFPWAKRPGRGIYRFRPKRFVCSICMAGDELGEGSASRPVSSARNRRRGALRFKGRRNQRPPPD